MLLWARVAGVLGVSALLMGSKIIIYVPAGGSVVSSSGLFACAAGEVCTIDIDERYFSETFTAEAEPGYEFSGWGNRADAVCRDSRDPYCRALDDGPFADREVMQSQLRSAGTLTMHPSFAATGRAVPASGSRFEVRSFHRTRYYPVSGDSQAELWAQLHGAANPLEPDREAGVKPLGLASFRYEYDYVSAFGENTSSCRVDSGTLKLHFETVLPQLAAGQRASDELQSRWQPLQEHITEHEAGHHAIYRQLVTQVPQVMSGLGAVPCQQLDQAVHMAVEETVAAIRRASANYDEHHGGENYLAFAR